MTLEQYSDCIIAPTFERLRQREIAKLRLRRVAGLRRYAIILPADFPWEQDLIVGRFWTEKRARRALSRIVAPR